MAQRDGVILRWRLFGRIELRVGFWSKRVSTHNLWDSEEDVSVRLTTVVESNLNRMTFGLQGQEIPPGSKHEPKESTV